jgi:hypothetical protein
MDIFLKSKLSCNSFPSTIQVVFEALFGINNNEIYNNMNIKIIIRHITEI